jgi:hypothetical protein
VGIDWDGLKNDFESGQAPLTALAEKYGCHADSIRRKAKKGLWERKSGEERNIIPEKRMDILPERHRNFWKGVERRLARGLKTKDVKLGLEELKVAKMAGEVISSMIRSKRLELGLEEAAAEKGDDEADLIAAAMAQATAPSGADEAVD